MSEEDKSVNNKIEFYKIIREFIPDLLTTFPEYKENLDDGIISILREEYENVEVLEFYDNCKSKFPERFFDILYQNEEMFSDSDIDTEFLPGIDFADLWNTDDITDKTKEILWKYLQLLLFSLISDVKDGSMFKDTAKLFEAIDEEEFKNKLEETMNNMQDVFGNIDGSNNDVIDSSNINLDNLPNADDVHSHINGMLGGKLGMLAREIAEETAEEMNIDMDNISSVGDVFKSMFKNPSKLMGIVKNVGNKLETKIKSGNINESELIRETTDIMGKMDSMPGLNNIKGMLDQFGMGGLAGMMGGKNVKMNTGAMKSHMKNMQMKERMKRKVDEKNKIQEEFRGSMDETSGNIKAIKDNVKTFRKGEAPERSTKRNKPVESFEDSIIDMNKPKKTNKSKKDKKKKTKK
jgi:hypothetical protein